jgi:hypothetical protein
MDNFKLIIIVISFLISSSNLYAIPLPPKYSVSTNSSTTTYKILPNSSTGNILTPQAPISSGSTAVSTSVSANSNGYISQVNLPIGQEIAAVNVTNLVTPIALASAVAGVVPQLATLAAFINAGSAIYNYLSSNNLNPSTGGVSGLNNLSTLTNGSSTPLTGICTDQFGRSPAESCAAQSSAQHPVGSFSTPFIIPDNSSLVKWGCTGQFGPLSAGATLFSCGNLAFKTQCGVGTMSSNIQTCDYPASNQVPTQLSLSQKLIASPPSPSEFASIISQLHNLDSSGNNDPISSLQADINSFPSTLNQPSSSSVSPTGSTSSTTTHTLLSSPDGQTLTATDTLTTTTTSPSGVVTTATTSQATPTGQNTATTPSQTDCEKNPAMIGCSFYGSPTVPDVIPIINVPITLTPTSLGSGSCPSPITFNLINGGSQVISWTPICDLAIGVNPLIIAMGWLMAGYMVIGSVKA